MKNKLVCSILWLTLFSLAMGYLEAVVVVFLRELYYPSGFRFPLVPMDATLAKVEFWREAATLVMLVGIGYLSGKTPHQRLAAFLYAFAIWDLAYYLFLKGVLNWPESLLTWDILFLIPVPWIGPVLAPCLLSLTMVLLASVLVRIPDKQHQLSLRRPDWLLLATGSAVVLISLVWDYLSFVLRQEGQVWQVSSQRSLFVEAAAYVPVDFNWWLFGVGELLLLWAIGQIAFRKSTVPAPPPAAAAGAEPESFSDYLNAL